VIDKKTKMEEEAVEDITITQEKVEGWKREVEKLEKRIKHDRMRLKFIQDRLRAVPLFQDERDKYVYEDEDTETPFEDLSPADAILDVLSKSEEGTLSAGELREAVIEAGYPIERWGKNFAYFYTVLKRLVDAGTVGKEGDRYSYP
jgi:hypothetical protein